MGHNITTFYLANVFPVAKWGMGQREAKRPLENNSGRKRWSLDSQFLVPGTKAFISGGQVPPSKHSTHSLSSHISSVLVLSFFLFCFEALEMVFRKQHISTISVLCEHL